MRIESWIRPESLQAVLEYLSHLVEYEFDPDDLAAIETALASTNNERGNWFEYPLQGKRTISLALARDAESPIVLSVLAATPADMEREVATVLALAQCYSVQRPSDAV